MSTNGGTLPARDISAELIVNANNTVLSFHNAGAEPVPPDMASSNQLLVVLNGLLKKSWTNVALEQQLEHALGVILDLPRLTSGLRGAIYLLDAHDSLRLAVSNDFPANTSRHTQESQIGERLCSNVGVSKQIDILQTYDHYDQPESAGESQYFGVPILNGPVMLGVFIIVSPHDLQRRRLESGFLWLITETLAALIMRVRTETENQRLLGENRRLNRRLIGILEEERRRLARELHDDVGQSLTAIKADAALILNHSGTTASPIRQSAQAISDTADHLYGITHALLRQLRPGALDDLGLDAALRSCVHTWHERRPGTACTLAIHGEIDNLGEDTNITIYRIAQEALNNVIRHAAAIRVDIVLRRIKIPGGTDELCLEIKDDGRGTDLESVQTKQRHGLVGIRERVEGLGGRLRLVSRSGQGFCLTACLPVAKQPDHERQP